MSQYDSDTVLHDATSTAITSTESSTGIAVKLAKSVTSLCKIVVDTLDYTTTDETYVLSLEVSDTLGSGYVEVARVTLDGSDAKAGLGVYELAVRGSLAERLKAGAVYARLTSTLGGTSPSINFVAYLTKAE